ASAQIEVDAFPLHPFFRQRDTNLGSTYRHVVVIKRYHLAAPMITDQVIFVWRREVPTRQCAPRIALGNQVTIWGNIHMTTMHPPEIKTMGQAALMISFIVVPSGATDLKTKFV